MSKLLLLVKPAASSCPPLDHEFPFVGSRVSTLGSTFTVEGSQTSQRNAKRIQKVCYVILFPRASERRVLPIVGVCKTSSHLHIFSSSHPLIFTSSHLHILSSSHLLIFTSSHLHIFTSSHLHIFSSSHLLILPSSPHLLIFTSSHIFSHLLTSSHLHTLAPLALLPSPSFLFLHPPIFSSSSHLHIFSHLLTSSHIFSSHTFSSCPLALSFFSISFLKAGAGAVATRRHETQPFRTK